MVSYFTPLPLREEFAKGVHCQYCYTLFKLRYLPISLKRAKGIQIEDHRIKIVDSADDAAIFLGDITCLNRIQVFWRCISIKDKLFKSQALWAGAYKNRTNQPGQSEWSQSSIKRLGVNSILYSSNWGISGTEWDSLWEVKKIVVNQILLSKLWNIG